MERSADVAGVSCKVDPTCVNVVAHTIGTGENAVDVPAFNCPMNDFPYVSNDVSDVGQYFKLTCRNGTQML